MEKHPVFSIDYGRPDLKAHLLQVITLMRASSSWKSFIKLLDRAVPKGNMIQLTIDDI